MQTPTKQETNTFRVLQKSTAIRKSANGYLVGKASNDIIRTGPNSTAMFGRRNRDFSPEPLIYAKLETVAVTSICTATVFMLDQFV